MPEHWKPWTKKVPAWLMLPILAILTPAILILSVWDGGIKQGASEVAEAWRDFMSMNNDDAKDGGR